MLIAQIEAFLETARRGNLSRAAEGLHVSQPALTARLQVLEEELGSTLFVRSRRGMQLTDAGRAFLPYAQRAIQALEDGTGSVTALRRGGAGELVLGAAPAVSAYVLPALLARFTVRHPRVRLIVRTGHSEEILEMVLRREIDVGLVRELRHPEIESIPLYEDELILVAHTTHPYADRGRIDLGEMAEARLIMFDRTSSYYELTNAFFRQAGVAPIEVMELDNIDAAKQMVGQGLGIALLPRTAVARELADGRMHEVSIKGTTPLRRRMVAIRRGDSGPATGPASAFLGILEEVPEILPGDPTDRPPG